MSRLPSIKNEKVWLSYYNESGQLLFLMTSKKDSRDWYYLYEVVEDTLNKLGKAKNPKELEEKHRVFERMCGK